MTKNIETNPIKKVRKQNLTWATLCLFPESTNPDRSCPDKTGFLIEMDCTKTPQTLDTPFGSSWTCDQKV